MPKPSLQRVEELFHAALALPPTDRASYLNAACGGDLDLRAAVEELLHHDESLTAADHFLTSPVASDAERYRPDAPTVPTSAASVPAELPMIPGYEVLGNLGRGGMGIVYKARQARLNRIVALKMLLPLGFATADQLARFRSEAEILARMRHPNIVPIYDVGEFEGRPYLVMEFVDGPSLGQFLAGKPQNPGPAARLIETLARTSQVVHDQGVIHRDLKPGNVLLERSGSELNLESATPKITDFGLAKDQAIARDLTLTGMMMGTPCYMAPEQARSDGTQVGPAADIYSLGTILYETLTGRPPFSAGTPEETILQVLNEEPFSPKRLVPSLPRDLVTICLKCLEKPPEKRYATAGELADDLQRFQAGEPIHARPVGAIERGIRWCRRRPLVAALSALSAVLFIGLLVAILIYNTQLKDALARVETLSKEQRQQIVQLNVHIGVTKIDEGDIYAALLRFTEALRLDEGTPEERSHRLRIAESLRLIPRLVEHRIAGEAIMAVGVRDSQVELATIRDGHTLETTDALTGQPTGKRIDVGATPRLIALSECGRWIATVEGDDTIRLWNRTTGVGTALPRRASANVARLVFHPDCSLLAVHYLDSAPVFWNLSAESPTEKSAPGSGKLAALSDDGRWMFRMEGDAVGRVWDTKSAATGAPLTMHHGSPVAAVSRDGKHVAVADNHHTLSLYDSTADGWHETVVNLPALLDDVIAESFSPDGRRLMLRDSDGDISICDAANGRLTMPLLRTHDSLASARFVGDRRLVTVAKSGLIRVWELPNDSAGASSAPPDERPVGDLIRLAQLLAGARINPSQTLERLSPAELQANWDLQTVR
jgi:eukaryotic-like serine/threonine-protein kinase